jgi:hypothetical protein
MAHAQPIGLTGNQLATNITNTGAFNIPGAQAGPLRSFGPGAYNSQTEEATIIGVRTGRKWRVFAQLHPREHRKMSAFAAGQDRTFRARVHGPVAGRLRRERS